MIEAVGGKTNYFGSVTTNRSNIASNSFKQEYIDNINRDRASFSQQPQQTQQSLGVEIRGSADIGKMHSFLNGLNHDADGSYDLTEEDIAELKLKYDLNNLTGDQRLDLLLELNKKNAISYTGCMRTTLATAEFAPGIAEHFEKSLRNVPGFEDFVMSPNNIAKDIKITLPSGYHHKPENICEEYQNYAMEWQAKYEATLKQYEGAQKILCKSKILTKE